MSSQAAPNSDRAVEPLRFRGDAARARQVLLNLLEAHRHAWVETAEHDFVHAVFRSRLGFLDDVAFLIRPEAGVIDIRSCSRLGYYDFGINRQRVERLRAGFAARLKTAG